MYLKFLRKPMTIIIEVPQVVLICDLSFVTLFCCQMARAQSFTSADKDKNPSTPRAKLGHRRVDETGETTYKKAS